MKTTDKNWDWDAIRHKMEKASAAFVKGDTISEEENNKILKKRTAETAKVKVEELDTGEYLNVIEFELGSEHYAIETIYLKEVHRGDTIYKIPNTPDFIHGVINFRGKIITIVDLKSFFQLDSSNDEKTTSKIIVEINNVLLGFTVDRIIGIREIPSGNIQKTKLSLQKIKESFIKGINNETLIVLDIENIVNDKDIQVGGEAL